MASPRQAAYHSIVQPYVRGAVHVPRLHLGTVPLLVFAPLATADNSALWNLWRGTGARAEGCQACRCARNQPRFWKRSPSVCSKSLTQRGYFPIARLGVPVVLEQKTTICCKYLHSLSFHPYESPIRRGRRATDALSSSRVVPVFQAACSDRRPWRFRA
jgi:hypothetical protein